MSERCAGGRRGEKTSGRTDGTSGAAGGQHARPQGAEADCLAASSALERAPVANLLRRRRRVRARARARTCSIPSGNASHGSVVSHRRKSLWGLPAATRSSSLSRDLSHLGSRWQFWRGFWLRGPRSLVADQNGIARAASSVHRGLLQLRALGAAHAAARPAPAASPTARAAPRSPRALPRAAPCPGPAPGP